MSGSEDGKIGGVLGQRSATPWFVPEHLVTHLDVPVGDFLLRGAQWQVGFNPSTGLGSWPWLDLSRLDSDGGGRVVGDHECGRGCLSPAVACGTPVRGVGEAGQDTFGADGDWMGVWSTFGDVAGELGAVAVAVAGEAAQG